MEEPEKQRFVTRASSYRERGSSGRWTLVGDPSNNWQVEWWAALRGHGGCGKVGEVGTGVDE